MYTVRNRVPAREFEKFFHCSNFCPKIRPFDNFSKVLFISSTFARNSEWICYRVVWKFLQPSALKFRNLVPVRKFEKIFHCSNFCLKIWHFDNFSRVLISSTFTRNSEWICHRIEWKFLQSSAVKFRNLVPARKFEKFFHCSNLRAFRQFFQSSFYFLNIYKKFWVNLP